MKDWIALYKQHRARRGNAGEALGSSLRNALVRLADQGICAASIQGRFTNRKSGRLREWYIASDTGREPLALPGMKHAFLTVLALADSRTHHVHQFTAMLEGHGADDATWVVAVHLEDDRAPPAHDRKGSGACGHAALHCHVGRSLEVQPQVRVPLPNIGPAEALEWLLSVVVPKWEPAPWPAVVAALDERSDKL